MAVRALVFVVAAALGSACDDTRPRLTFPSQTPPVTAAPPPAPVPPGQPPNLRERGPMPIPAARITAGEIVGGAVQVTDPVCFPNWDSTGRCHQYEFTAAADGELVAILSWDGPDRGFYSPELFLVAPDESWLYADEIYPSRRGRSRITQGATYRLVVVAYGPYPDSYSLSAELYR